MQSKKNIFLIGFMGAGKSTVARYLHRQQGMNWLEMDKEIERKEGMPVSSFCFPLRIRKIPWSPAEGVSPFVPAMWRQ